MSVVYTRSMYRAPALGSGMSRQASPREAFLHHTADAEGLSYNTKDEQVAKVRSIDKQHRAQGWEMIGYHWVVFQRTGTRNEARAYQARPAIYVPAAQENHNTRTLAICVVGNGERETMFADTRSVIREIIRRYSNIQTLGGHKDVVATACPGRNFYSQIPTIVKLLDGVTKYR
jgi:hypothetical protein